MRKDSALQLLEDLDKEHQVLKGELIAAQEELQRLDVEELKYWSELNDLEMDLLNHQEELANVHQQYDYANAQLEKLNKSNALTDTFKIWHEGPFGTINGLRLGRLPSQHVLVFYLGRLGRNQCSHGTSCLFT